MVGCSGRSLIAALAHEDEKAPKTATKPEACKLNHFATREESRSVSLPAVPTNREATFGQTTVQSYTCRASRVYNDLVIDLSPCFDAASSR